MPPLPLASELSARSLPSRPDPCFVLRPPERDLGCVRVAAAPRVHCRSLWEKEWQGCVEGVSFGSLCGRGCCCWSRGGGIGCGDSSGRGAVVRKGRLIEVQIKVEVEIEL
jgi:hypothetical protein